MLHTKQAGRHRLTDLSLERENFSTECRDGVQLTDEPRSRRRGRRLSGRHWQWNMRYGALVTLTEHRKQDSQCHSALTHRKHTPRSLLRKNPQIRFDSHWFVRQTTAFGVQFLAPKLSPKSFTHSTLQHSEFQVHTLCWVSVKLHLRHKRADGQTNERTDRRRGSNVVHFSLKM